jgi:hypothetical protein
MRVSRKVIVLACLLVATVVSVRAAGDGPQPFTIAIKVTNGALRVGDEVRIHVTLENVSSKQIMIRRTPSPAQAEEHYAVRVRYADGKDVPRTEYGTAADSRQFAGSKIKVRLMPGETMEEDTVLSKQFNLSSPGEYTVQLSRPVSDDLKDGIVKSNKLTVSIAP